MKKINLLMPAVTTLTTSLFIGTTSCVVHIGGGDTPQPIKKYTIGFESEGILQIEDLQNAKGSDYIGKITLNEGFKENYDIPQTNCYYDVKVGDSVINDFDVDQIGDQNNYYATITIPSHELTKGSIINIVAKKCSHYLCVENTTSTAMFLTSKTSGSIDANIQYSGDGEKWFPWTDEIGIPGYGMIYLRNTKTTLSTQSGYFSFTVPSGIDKTFAVSGNIMSMVNFGSLSQYCFRQMFENFPISNMVPILPAQLQFGVCGNCYQKMFAGCQHLNNAPELPSSQLDRYCYSEMFSGCLSLALPPELPAETTTDSCYQKMFSGCSGLTKAMRLPATQLQNNCYKSMFESCTNLEIIENGKSENFIFSYQDDKTTENLSNMFSNTKGHLDEGFTPKINTEYYWA